LIIGGTGSQATGSRNMRLKFKPPFIALCATALSAVALNAVAALAAPVLNPANNHNYEAIAVLGGLTWQEARTAAAARVYQGKMGHLVSIESANENQFVYDNCPAAISGNWWIGGYQFKTHDTTEPAGNWVWIEGQSTQSPAYFNWQSGEPNNNGGVGPSEDYLQILSNGKWNDQNGALNLGGYVVEYDQPIPTGKIAFASGDIYAMNADGSNVTNLTNSSAIESTPSFNGDGSKIAYASAPTTGANGAAASEIYLMNADGSGQTRLTNNPYYDGDPQLSRDGTKIVFVSNRGFRSEIYVMNSDGSGQTRLTDTTGGSIAPALSPDGSKIAFSTGDIYVMNADGSNQTNLTHSAADREEQPVFSPDGKTLLFTDYPEDFSAPVLFAMNIDGTNIHPVSYIYAPSSPSFSPDGLWLADNGIKLTRSDGSYQMAVMGSLAIDPTWAPGSVPPPPVLSVTIDGGSTTEGDTPTISLENTTTPQVTFTIHLNNARLQSYAFTYRTQPISAIAYKDYYPVSGTVTFTPGETQKQISVPIIGDLLHEPNEILALVLTDLNYTVTGDLTGLGTVIDDDAEAQGGGKIAFVSTRDGNNEIYTMNADGSNQTDRTNAPNNDRTPSWSPDGTKIVWSRGAASGGAGADIYTMNEDGSSLLNLTNDGPDDMEPAYLPPTYLPEGSIVYSSFGGFDYDVFKVATGGGERTRIINNPLGDYHPRFNSAGSRLAFYTFPDGQTADIYVADAGGTGQVRLTTATGHDRYAEWSPTGDKIVFTSQRDGNDEIYVMNADGSNQTRLTTNAASDEQPCFSPDGAQIAFSSNRDGNYEIYIMNADGSGQTRITQSAGDDTSPSWATGEVLASRPMLSVNDITVFEGRTATFTVTLSQPSARKIDVSYTTADGTTTSQEDYFYASGTVSFAPGQTSKIVSVPVRYDNVTDDGEYFYLNLYTPRNALLGDGQGKAIITERGRPDLSIHRTTDGDTWWVGGDFFYTQPFDGNTRTYWIGAGDSSVFQVGVKNTSPTPLSFVLKSSQSDTGTPSSSGAWTSTIETVGVDVTTSFRGADGYTTPLLNPGDVQLFTVRVTPNGNVPIGSAQALDITAAQSSEPNSANDLVRAQVVRGVRQPDLLIAAPTDAQAIGEGLYSPIYSSSGASQEKKIEVAGNQKATYLVTLQNDGEAPDSYYLYTLSSAPGWIVKTFDAATGGNDISYSIYSSQGYATGWNSSVIQPGQSLTLRLEITPDTTLAPGASFTFPLAARSNSDFFKADTVTATTTILSPARPDLQIKTSSEDNATYGLNNIYQSTPAGAQIETQTVASGATATFDIAVDNDGATANSFLLRATPNAATGWTSIYKLGSTDISSQILGAGFNTGTIQPSARKTITLTLTPVAGSGHREAKHVVLQVFASGTSTPVLDAVEAVAGADNLAPIANGQSVTLNEDTSTLITLTADDGDGDALGYTIASVPSHGALYAGQNAGGHRIAANELPYALAANQVFYAPDANWNGSDGLTFTASDAGGASPPATVSLKVNPVNDEPVLSPIPDASGKRGTAITFVAQASDMDSDVLHYSLVGAPDGADIYDLSGAFAWTPAQIQTTGIYNFKVRVFDGLVNVDQPVKITVSEDNKSPLSVGDEYSAHEDLPLVVVAPGVLGNDSDAENQTLTAVKIAGAQHGTVTLNANGSFSYTPNTGFIGDDSFSYQASDGAALGATANVTIHVAPDKADLQIKKSSEADTLYGLDNIYQSTPSGEQIETQTVSPGVKAVFSVRVQNESGIARSFLVKATEGIGEGWTIAYKLGTADISTALRSSAGRTTATLAAGASEVLNIEMTPATGAARGIEKTVVIQVLNSGDNTVRDAVQAAAVATPASGRQPDISIKTASEAEYAGGNIYNTDGAGQTTALSTRGALAAQYVINVQNDGNAAERIKLQSTKVASGWTLKYLDSSNVDITAAMIASDGWLSPSLNPGATQTLRLEVTPGTAVLGGGKSSVTLTATSTGDTTKKDVVIATTQAQTVVQPDALIKKSTEADTAYALDNIYQTVPGNAQIEAQNVQAGQKVTYTTRVQNDGNTSRSFVVRTTESGASWSVVYKVGSTVVTTPIKSAAGRTTAVLAPGASEVITVEVTAGSGLGVGVVQSTLLQVFDDVAGFGANQIRDAIQAVTTVTPTPVMGVDAAIRTASESIFLGEGLVNTTGTGQTSSQNTARTVAASFRSRLKNTGNMDDKIKLLGTGSVTGWSVKYFDGVSNADITSAVVAGTWNTPALAAGATYDVRLEITPASNVALNSSRTWTLTSTSTANMTKTDVVKAIVTTK
jgi:VCBS repeat-containing protein